MRAEQWSRPQPQIVQPNASFVATLAGVGPQLLCQDAVSLLQHMLYGLACQP